MIKFIAKSCFIVLTIILFFFIALSADNLSTITTLFELFSIMILLISAICISTLLIDTEYMKTLSKLLKMKDVDNEA